ncbi:MAG: hypothetical protein F8N37_00005 [Telmatospirillum sp.]|nr:hypothetical protein [Telmatospirillum sp.]
MSAESQGHNLPSFRKLREEEKLLIGKMAGSSTAENEVLHRIVDVCVEDMKDGGMGSIRFHYDGGAKRVFGRNVSEATYRDADGVVVSIALNIDQFGLR